MQCIFPQNCIFVRKEKGTTMEQTRHKGECREDEDGDGDNAISWKSELTEVAGKKRTSHKLLTMKMVKI